MIESLLRAFDTYPKEGAIIGRILASYGRLEIDVMNCVGKLNDVNDALKAMYRHRGETKRLRHAEDLGTHRYAKHNLSADFASAIGGVRYCLQIRSLYSHCQWHDDRSGELAYVDLEGLARRKAHVHHLRDAPMYHVDLPFLQAQENFFQLISSHLRWLGFEARYLDGEFPTRKLAKPAQIQPPPLHKP